LRPLPKGHGFRVSPGSWFSPESAPADGHTLGAVNTETQDLTGVEIKRAYVDKGYVGHNAPKPLRVYRSGHKRGVHGQIKKELRRRAAIEPVIGHLKSQGRLERNYLKGRHGDRANAVLTAAGYNFRLVLRWLRKLLYKHHPTSSSPQNRFLTDDCVTP
jgi:IS5 family transposase